MEIQVYKVKLSLVKYDEKSKEALEHPLYEDLRYYYKKFGDIPHIELKQVNNDLILTSRFTSYFIAIDMKLEYVDAIVYNFESWLISKLEEKNLIEKRNLEDLKRKGGNEIEDWNLIILFFKQQLSQKDVEWLENSITSFYNEYEEKIKIQANNVRKFAYNSSYNCIEYECYYSMSSIDRNSMIKVGEFFSKIDDFRSLRSINGSPVDTIVSPFK
ncbi:MAG: hypothetical protein ACFB0B_11880 [Thermonemataceae bacterium]